MPKLLENYVPLKPLRLLLFRWPIRNAKSGV